MTTIREMHENDKHSFQSASIYECSVYSGKANTHNHMTHSTFIGTELRLVRAIEYQKNSNDSTEG